MPSITPRTESVVTMWRRASERERALLGEMHLHYEREIRRLKDADHEPQDLAHTIHGLIDASVAHTMATDRNAPNVKCAKGCAGCCSLFVNITQAEAVLLVGWCADQGIAIDWDRVAAQAQHDLATWKDQKHHQRRCVFLGKDDTCQVYEHRPAQCRKYLVVTDPKYCNTVRHPGATVGILAPVEGEVITSAMLGLMENGLMARMLLAARDEGMPPP